MTDSAGGGGFPHFIDAVSRRSGLPTEQAAALARAVLQTMAERVTGGVPDDLVGHLPDQVDGYLNDFAPPSHSDVPGSPSDLPGLPPDLGGSSSDVPGLPSDVPPADAGPAEFLRRVGQRAGVDPATARAGTGAVFATLREAVTVREFREMVARLPRDGDAAPGLPALPDL
ncbi:DUF2267 domain-containing protein [Micromonospora profundi]|uniref:DUF2267 domain-containing protein n=1 Tax=Micromonospora profundi TaxID=1420889 RepID=A0AAJ6L3U4_9ACTN|nr:DUF2267 domain-containing protein [Micromonospora profundi]WLS43663.1 DUF2267 domain-containing protein [Micromonospora profundi]